MRGSWKNVRSRDNPATGGRRARGRRGHGCDREARASRPRSATDHRRVWGGTGSQHGLRRDVEWSQQRRWQGGRGRCRSGEKNFSPAVPALNRAQDDLTLLCAQSDGARILDTQLARPGLRVRGGRSRTEGHPRSARLGAGVVFREGPALKTQLADPNNFTPWSRGSVDLRPLTLPRPRARSIFDRRWHGSNG